METKYMYLVTLCDTSCNLFNVLESHMDIITDTNSNNTIWCSMAIKEIILDKHERENKLKHFKHPQLALFIQRGD